MREPSVCVGEDVGEPLWTARLDLLDLVILPQVLALAVSGDGRYLASGGRDRLIHVWDCRTNGHVETFRGHQDAVSALSFRTNSLALFSGSHDRCVKVLVTCYG